MMRVAATVVSGLVGVLGVLLALPIALLLGANGHSEQELSELRGRIILVGVGGAGIVTAFGAILTLVSHFSTWRMWRAGKVAEVHSRRGPAIMLVGSILWLVAFLLVDMFAGNTGADFPPVAYLLPAFMVLTSIANHTTAHR